MATDTLSLILLPLAGIILLAGLITAVVTFVRIIRTNPKRDTGRAIMMAEGLLYGSGIKLPMFMETREEARSAILAAAAECDKKERWFLLCEAGITGMAPNPDTAIAMRAHDDLIRIAKSL